MHPHFCAGFLAAAACFLAASAASSSPSSCILRLLSAMREARCCSSCEGGMVRGTCGFGGRRLCWSCRCQRWSRCASEDVQIASESRYRRLQKEMGGVLRRLVVELTSARIQRLQNAWEKWFQ